MKSPVPEADWLKLTEIGMDRGSAPDSPFGGKPDSIRKRGWFRAFRGGRLSAITSPRIFTYLMYSSCPYKFKYILCDVHCDDSVYVFWGK